MLDVSFVDDNSIAYKNKKHKSNSYQNNPNGLNHLIKDIFSLAKTYNFTDIIFGFEATGIYGFHIPFYLHNEEKLNNLFNIQIFQINPKVIKNFRKAFNDIPKTDKHDSMLIARRLMLKNLPPYSKFDPKYFSLRSLTRQRFDLVNKMVSEKSHFLSHLFIKSSSFTQEKVFSTLFGTTITAILTEFESIDDIINCPIEDLVDLIIKKSKNKVAKPDEFAKKIKYLSRESYRLDRIMHNSIQYALLSSFNHIKFLKKEIKNIDKQIESQLVMFKDQYNILTSIKGIGKVFAAGIISEITDINLFESQSQIAKYAGIVWSIKQSGNFKSSENHLTKTGNRYLRYYLTQAAQLVSMKNPDFIPYYQKKKKEAVKHQHKRAVMFVARKLIRVIFSLLKNNKLYQSPKNM
jgi:transposase